MGLMPSRSCLWFASQKRCGRMPFLLLLMMIFRSGEMTDTRWRRAAVNSSVFSMQTYSSAVTMKSRIRCAGLCSRTSNCHVFNFLSETRQCFLSPTPGRGKLTTSFPLNHVYFDGITCPLNSTYQLASPTSCLKVYTTKMTVASARQVCGDDGASIMTLKTVEKSAVLVDFLNLTTGGSPTVLLDASDPSLTNQWAWADGDTFNLTHPLWRPGQPEGGKGCLYAYPYLGRYTYDDVYCTRVDTFVCEIVITNRM